MRKLTAAVISALMAATCVVSGLGLGSVSVNADLVGDIVINSANFKDSYFMEYVKKFDTNGNGILSQAERDAVTEINIRKNTTIKDLSGIKFFSNLKKLDAYQAKVESKIDLRENKNLEYLDLELNPVYNIDISECSKLTHLDLFGTSISNVDFSASQNLIYLDVSGTYVSTVNIIHEASIINTYKNNPAKEATYSKKTVIGHGDYKSGYYFSYNPGANVIDTCPEGYIDYNDSLFKNSNCYIVFKNHDNNKDGLLSDSENKEITRISLRGYEYKTYEMFKYFPYITHVSCITYRAEKRDANEITYFDGSYFPNLKVLEIENNLALSSIDVSQNTNLTSIKVESCKGLTSIKLGENKNLQTLVVDSCNSLTSIKFGENTNLQTLIVDSCYNLNSIDISNCSALNYISLRYSGVESIDISNNPTLLNIYTNPEKHYVYDEYEDFAYEVWRIGKEYQVNEIVLSEGITVITEKQVTPSNPVTPGGSTTPVNPTVPGSNVTPNTQVSPETGLAGFIERLYNVALGRQSEAQGKNWWINKVKFENYTGSDVANGFLVSDEFLGKQMSNDQFLEVLYKTFFDRNSDAQGKAYWLNLMANGYSKQDVINGFCNSTEWANLCLTYGIPSGSSAAPTIVITPNEVTNAFVTRLYTTCLGRAPEQAGFEYWTYRLANMQERGSSAAYGFFTSPEFTGKGYDNATYVTLLYRTILGREPDQAGLNYWLGLMANGMNRVDVLNGFAASTEWADICSGFGILK